MPELKKGKLPLLKIYSENAPTLKLRRTRTGKKGVKRDGFPLLKTLLRKCAYANATAHEDGKAGTKERPSAATKY
jgi:hypothetical protein